MLTEPCHEIVERSIRATARDVGAVVHAVGMVADHVHVAVSIPPSLAISLVVGKLKGASSRLLNTAGPYSADGRFGWQQEYGGYSVSERALAVVCDYVNDQPRRHAVNDTIHGLEKI